MSCCLDKSVLPCSAISAAIRLSTGGTIENKPLELQHREQRQASMTGTDHAVRVKTASPPYQITIAGQDKNRLRRLCCTELTWLVPGDVEQSSDVDGGVGLVV